MSYCSERRRAQYLKHKEKEIADAKKWRERNPEKRKEYVQKTKLLKRYGITVEEYNLMFEEQDGCCFICEVHQSELERALAVDHCHDTGEVRGLLCTNCNLGLGNFKDDIELLEKAIRY